MSYLFIYGTLRKACPNSQHHLLERYAAYVAEASLPGRLYEVDGYPGAVLSRRQGERVYGELYRITHARKLFALLDDYEGCSARFPLPHEYLRKRVPLQLADGTSVTAWGYLYNREVTHLRCIASGDYLAVCR